MDWHHINGEDQVSFKISEGRNLVSYDKVYHNAVRIRNAVCTSQNYVLAVQGLLHIVNVSLKSWLPFMVGVDNWKMLVRGEPVVHWRHQCVGGGWAIYEAWTPIALHMPERLLVLTFEIGRSKCMSSCSESSWRVAFIDLSIWCVRTRTSISLDSVWAPFASSNRDWNDWCSSQQDQT